MNYYELEYSYDETQDRVPSVIRHDGPESIRRPIIDIKRINIGDKLLTVSLLPELYRFKARNQLKKTSPALSFILKCLTDHYTYCAELTKKGAVHYHVIYHSHNSDEFIIDQFKESKCFGNVFINEKPLSNDDEIERTVDYIFEDFMKTNKIINYKKLQHRIFYDQWVKQIQSPDHKSNNKIKFNKYLNLDDGEAGIEI